METARSARTRQWLTDHDLTTQGDPDDVAHGLIPLVLQDPDLDPADRLEVGLGLLELLDHYWVTVELRWFVNAAGDEALAATHWQAVRDHLEEPEPSDAVLYSLWVDWFEDPATVERAFAEVLGNDVAALGGGDERLLRRAAAVLRESGPVPWRFKHPVYEAATEVPALRPAVYRGLLTSYHDIYGFLEIGPALALLDRLDLPPDTEHLADLRGALAEGHTNYYRRNETEPPGRPSAAS